VVDVVAEMTIIMTAVHHQENLQKRIPATAVLVDAVLQAKAAAAAVTTIVVAAAVLHLTEMSVDLIK
jgi:hypothetical protein